MSKALFFGVIIVVVIAAAFLVLARLSVAPDTLSGPPTENNPILPTTSMLKLISPTFTEGKMIPSEYTCDGVNVSPALNIEGAPATARSFALIMNDPDSPSGHFTHWLIWNIPAATAAIEKGSAPLSEAGATQGQNDFGKPGYGGPCPGSGTHRYVLTLYALDTTLNLPGGASLVQLKAAMSGRVLEQAALVGKYARQN